MRKVLPIITVAILSACSADVETSPRPAVSRAGDPVVQGMSYEEFKGHSMNNGSDMSVVQKRFILLDRDHNGVLSANEFGD